MALKFDASERAIAQSIGPAIGLLQDSANEQLADLESAAVAAHGVKLDGVDDLDQTEAIKRISDAKFADSFSANQIQGSARRNEF